MQPYQINMRSTSSRVISFAGAVVELGDAGALVCGHWLRVPERNASLEVGGDAGRREGVAADPDAHAERGGAALDHAVGLDAVHAVAPSSPVRPSAERKREALAGLRMLAASM